MSKKKKRRPAPRRVAGHIKNRAGLVFLVILGLMCILIVRIVYINGNKGQDYNKKILTQMSYDSKTIQAERGKIMDRNGTSLAYNENRYNVIIEPKNLLADEDNLKATLTALTECYSDCEYEKLEQQIRDNPNSLYKRILKQITEEEMQKFLDYKEAYQNSDSQVNTENTAPSETETTDSSAPETEALEPDGALLQEELETAESETEEQETKEAVNKETDGTGEIAETAKKGKITGVYFEKDQKRIYPYDNLASTTVGFANSAGGLTGLEKQYDDLLKGVNGRRFGYLNEESSVDVQTIEETDGYSLVMTLDANIQKMCQDVIAEYDERVGSNMTALMVMNPNNGEIYAMANSSQYNLNDPYNMDGKFTEEEWNALDDDKRSEALLLHWRNFCVSESYEPGSTAKLFTIAAGLEEKCIDQNSTFGCDGVGVYGGSRIHCHYTRGHGTLTLTGSIMASCNDALMQIGIKTGADIFCDYQSKFNLGQKTGIDLPDEQSCANQIYHADNMTDVDLATNSFGQNFYVTMVQMCAAYSSIVNGGNYYQPHVVKEILDTEGNVVRKIDPVLVRQTVSRETSEFLKEALFQTVENGTANRVKIAGYEIGAKTGTAEKANKGSADETYTISLMAVAPAYNPEVVVYAVVDEPNCSKGENTYQAKDLCKAAMEKILPYLNIYPTADGDKVSSSDGNFTSPENDEMYDEGSIIEDEQNAADEIRNAANQALNNNGNQNQPEGGDQNQPEGGGQNQPEGGDQNQPEGGQ